MLSQVKGFLKTQSLTFKENFLNTRKKFHCYKILLVPSKLCLPTGLTWNTEEVQCQCLFRKYLYSLLLFLMISFRFLDTNRSLRHRETWAIRWVYPQFCYFSEICCKIWNLYHTVISAFWDFCLLSEYYLCSHCDKCWAGMKQA